MVWFCFIVVTKSYMIRLISRIQRLERILVEYLTIFFIFLSIQYLILYRAKQNCLSSKDMIHWSTRFLSLIRFVPTFHSCQIDPMFSLVDKAHWQHGSVQYCSYLVACESYLPPGNGYQVSCNTKDMRTGTLCSLTCSEGYEPEGHLQIGIWCHLNEAKQVGEWSTTGGGRCNGTKLAPKRKWEYIIVKTFVAIRSTIQVKVVIQCFKMEIICNWLMWLLYLR